jgi:hypothetical protein
MERAGCGLLKVIILDSFLRVLMGITNYISQIAVPHLTSYFPIQEPARCKSVLVTVFRSEVL